MGITARAEKASVERRWLSVLLVVALVVTGGFVAVTVWTQHRTDAECVTLERDSAEAAADAAVRCGEDVEVLSARTPWENSFARPDGSVRYTVGAIPSQTDVNGEWEPIDTTVSEIPEPVVLGLPGAGKPGPDGASLARGAAAEAVPPGVAGMLPVTAPTFPIWVNPGGEAGEGLPIGVIARDASWMKLWFPLPLGASQVDGRFVTYDLGPGARLVVAILSDGAGFRPIVELDSPAAAEWFRLALVEARSAQGLPGEGFEIPYAVEASENLTLRGIGDAGFELVTAEEEVLFWSPPSVMWDSAAGPTDEDRREFPATGDRALVMPVRVDESTDMPSVVVSPDDDMLTSSDTAWPVRIDPTTGARTPAEWVQLRTGGFTAPKYKWTDTAARNGESMGRCLTSWRASCNANFTARLVWEFGGLGSLMTPLVGADIISATFTADPTDRGNCTSSRTDAHVTSDIVSTNPSWSSISFNTLQSHLTAPQGDHCSDGGVRRAWSVKAAAVNAANANLGTISIGLKANNETNSNGYKTYRADARLEIVYNRAPGKPASLKLASPDRACVAGAGRPVIATTTPTLSTVVTDPDGGNVQAHFQITAPGSGTEVWTSGTLAAKTSGSTFTAAVTAGKLVHGQSYRYRATATDGTAWSGWGETDCEFTVDVEAPVAPAVAPVTTGVAAVYESGRERGGVGLGGSFQLNRGASADVVQFAYSFNSTALDMQAVPDAAGLATIAFSPTAPGPTTLRVRTADAAGNLSPILTYTFTVAHLEADAVWMLDEGTGTTAADTSGRGEAKSLTVSGATWLAGPHEEFGSRAGDKALRFDGVNDAATSAAIVDTRTSFVVSAYVWLDAAKIGTGTFTAVSQDGLKQSGFALSYQQSCPDVTGGCWAFGMANTDAAPAATVARSAVPVVGDRWVHLVGAHDATTKTVSLWVCEIGTPQNPGVGNPVKKSESRTATPWAAPGAFVLGRGLVDGAATQWWPGRIDNVRVFDGQIAAEAKIRRLCQGAEARDFSTGLDALDPTTLNGQ